MSVRNRTRDDGPYATIGEPGLAYELAACVLCGATPIAEHHDVGALCEIHAIAIALMRGRRGAAARAALYEHAAHGRVELIDENGPEFTATPDGERWAREEIASWPAA